MSTNLCGLIGGNTGPVLCDTKRKRPLNFTVGSKEFPASEYGDPATFKAAFQAAIKLPQGSANKLFPFPEVGEVTINTPAATRGNLQHGPSRRLTKGKPSYTYTVEIGWDQYQRLLAFDGKTVPVYTFDEGQNVWGYRAGAAAGTLNTNNFKGEMAYIDIEGSGFEDGASAQSGQARITISYLSVDDFEKRGTYITLEDTVPSDFEGLKPVQLVKISNVDNVYKIGMYNQQPKLGGDLNIFDEFGAAIAALTFAAGTGTNYGTTLAITSVAVDNTLKALTVTLDSTAYTALSAGTKIKLSAPTPAQLDGADVPNIELLPVILTR